MKHWFALVALAVSSSALSTDWIEGSGGSGDAGATVATAQNVIGPAGLTSIKGVVTQSDGDIYKITIVTPGSFSASTGTSSSGADTQLFLFKADGTGAAFNDDITEGADYRSTLSGAVVTSLPAGTYYVGVSRYDSDAQDAGANELWLDSPYSGTRAPDGAGAANAMSTMAQSLTSIGCRYTITLTGCDPGTIGAAQPPPSTAGTWSEVGDAGDLIGTSQMTTGSGALTKIYGDLPNGNDVDMFVIKVTNPAAFTASLVGNGSSIADSQLSLFKADGTGAAFNDDDPAFFSLQSAFDATVSSIVTVPGTYYIAVAQWDSPAQSAGGSIWAATPYESVRAPDGPGAAGALTGWSYDGATIAGDYIIDMTGVEYGQTAEVTLAPVTLTPGPGTILSGGITEVSTSNDVRLAMRPGAILVATADPLVLIASYTAPGATASSLKVQVETKSTVSGIRQIVEVRNFTTAAWDVLETFVGLPFGASPDRAVTLVVASPNDHIGPGNEVRVRTRYKNTTAVLVYPWQVQFDELTVRYTP